MSVERYNLVNLCKDNSDVLDVIPTSYDSSKLSLNFKWISRMVNSKNFMKFEDFSKHKYIIDCQSKHGPHKMSHSGRLFWEFHMNRVLFIPTDASLLWFQTLPTKPEPWVHYVPYNYEHLDTIPTDIRKLESDPELYTKIKKNCREYSDKYLRFENILDYVCDILK